MNITKMKLLFILLILIENQFAKGSWLVSKAADNLSSQNFQNFHKLDEINDWLQEMKKSIPLKCSQPDPRPLASKKSTTIDGQNRRFGP
jgi:ABC-type microcin C transport system permease subunit YejB